MADLAAPCKFDQIDYSLTLVTFFKGVTKSDYKGNLTVCTVLHVGECYKMRAADLFISYLSLKSQL